MYMDFATIGLILALILVFSYLYHEQGKLYRVIEMSKIDLEKLKKGLRDDLENERELVNRIKNVNDAIDFMAERNKRKNPQDKP